MLSEYRKLVYAGDRYTDNTLLFFYMKSILLLQDFSLYVFVFITKTYLYNFDPLKPYFYIVKLGFTGVYIIFLISAQQHRL